METDIAPFLLRECDIAHHDSLWSLREYHLSPDDTALPYGSVLDGFIPQGYNLQERDHHLTVTDLAGNEVSQYNRWRNGDTNPEDRDRDIILIGEGHSNWGSFSLCGRVRKPDGFVGILKRYVSQSGLDKE